MTQKEILDRSENLDFSKEELLEMNNETLIELVLRLQEDRGREACLKGIYMKDASTLQKKIDIITNIVNM